MNKIASAKKGERQRVFTEVAAALELTPFVVEKDFWVSWILGKIFADSELRDALCFKGGTSLSKAFNLIKRFSEDIDLILSQKLVLRDGEQLIQPSNSKQDKFNKEIEARAGAFISHELKLRIAAALSPLCEVQGAPDDDHTLFVVYPRVFDDAYIQPVIKLEIGPLALWDPNDDFEISSFVSSALPQLELVNPRIPTVKPTRTFWEKLTILHHEHHRPEGSFVPLRYSRHYYDAFMMDRTWVKQEALRDVRLLAEVTNFKQRFYPRRWAKYEEAVPGSLRLLPPLHSQATLRNDYANMTSMIYASPPSWDEILSALALLENEINSL